MSRTAPLLLLACLLGSSTAGCALSMPPPVKPWQREHLARRALRFDGGSETLFRQHLFSSREGADGGYGQVGGGCGCN